MFRFHRPMHTATCGLFLGVAACLSMFSFRCFAQEVRSPARSDEKLALSTEAVGPRRFIAAHGRRALVDGYATGCLEVWAYPFQILNGYRVAFRASGTTTAIDGADILSRVVYEPDSVTRVYIGPDFIVHEKLFVPLDRAGAILTYSIQSPAPVEIEVHAIPVLNLMWPAGLGGQNVQWRPALSAFELEEPGNGFTAVVGSPEIVAHDSTENRTQNGAGAAGFGFTLHPESSGVARVFVSLNPPHAADPGLLFHELIRDSETLQAEAASHFHEVRENLMRVETPDARVNQAIDWAEMALDQAWVCNSDLGCGYVAGYGPSRDARRAQYEWFFAGDGMVAANGALSAGDRAHAREELEFILRYQDTKTGIIWHELSQSAGFLDWVGKYPYMYVHVDLTFQFIETVGRYVAETGDIAFAKQHWQAIEAAYHYCRSVIDPATALPRIPADKEGGNEQDRMSDDLGLSASWVAATESFAQLATLTGHGDLAAESLRASQSARTVIRARFWDAKQAFWISGHTTAGQAMPERRGDASDALILHLFNPQQNTLLLDQLSSSNFQTDWGARSIGAGSPGYEPESYGKGSVWALGTAAMAGAFWSEHRPLPALNLWNALVRSSTLDSMGHMHEVMAGNFYRPQVESVPEQTWSSAGFLDATIHGLLGLQADSIANRLVFAPRLPADWNDLSLERIRLSDASISLELHRNASGLTLEIDNPGGPFKLDFAPDLPLGATIRRAAFNHQPIAVAVQNYPQQTEAKVALNAPHGKSELQLDLQGGVAVIAEPPATQLGEVSSGIHIVDLHLEGGKLTIAADVPSDRASHVRIRTAWKVVNATGVTIEPLTNDLVELTFAATHDVSSPYRRALATLEVKP